MASMNDIKVIAEVRPCKIHKGSELEIKALFYKFFSKGDDVMAVCECVEDGRGWLEKGQVFYASAKAITFIDNKGL